MEGLRAQARDDFKRWHRSPLSHQAPVPLGLITIRQFRNKAILTQASPSPQDLAEEMTRPLDRHEGETPTASLRLVRIHTNEDDTIAMDEEVFLDLFVRLGLDVYWLDIFRRNALGFFQIPGQDSSSYSFCIDTEHVTLIWSYSSTTLATYAIIMTGKEVYRTSDSTWTYFVAALDRHKILVDNPRFLSFIFGVDLLPLLDSKVSAEFHRISQVERETGYGVWSNGPTLPVDTERLANSSREIGTSLVRLANLVKNLTIAKSIFDDLVSAPLFVAAVPLPSEGKIKEAARLLRPQVDSFELWSSYAQKRASTQQTVIFNLLAREDANISKELAIAAKKDSSSMKTVAVMTMAFLPATFLAALFAVPMLQWQEENVVSGRFWIYWAFTLPCTALVFLIWWALGRDWRKVVEEAKLRGSKRRDEKLRVQGYLEDYPEIPGEEIRNPPLFLIRENHHLGRSRSSLQTQSQTFQMPEILSRPRHLGVG